jgi:uridine phosphorylase
MQKISEADLIINQDGSIYHLNILPEDVAPIVITVGDQDRVSEISKHFDHVELRKGKREFLTHTGTLGGKRLTVISTGIGTDNIDIVLNELDALVNIDFHTREVKERLTSLSIIRIGTSGSVQPDLPIGSIVASSHGFGIDALMNYYQSASTQEEVELLHLLKSHMTGFDALNPYLTSGSSLLLDGIAKDLLKGITVTAPGFYAPQGRKVRAQVRFPSLIEQLGSFRKGDARITNLEMETAGIYALAKVLGHKALSINAVLASRATFAFSKNPQVVVDKAIIHVLERINNI